MRSALTLTIAFVTACSGPTVEDAGMLDAARDDGSVADAGGADSGAMDAGMDAGTLDGGTDGGTMDGGADGGSTEGGTDSGADSGMDGGAGEGEACSASMPCAGGLVCEAVGTCQRPFVVRGTVTDAATLAPIGGALVIALDANGLALSGTATSAADGSFELRVPVARDASGRPVATPIVLYANASGYLRQPRGFLRSTELDAGSATEESSAWALSATITLVPSGTSGLPISGRVDAAERASVLVVAQAGGVVRTALSDRDGAYTIFDAPSGTVAVLGYRTGVALDPISITVSSPGASGVDLAASSALLSSVSGTVTFINAPGASITSVQLFVVSTFDTDLDLGDTPYGLRADGVGSTWTIDGVAPGSYFAVAAIDDDQLVIDPDASIAGSGPQSVVVNGSGAPVFLASSFKVTAAIGLGGPGASGPEAVTSAPTLMWNDVAAEDFYRVGVVDARGALVWESADVVGSVSVPYAGPLDPGMQYRFRVTAFRDIAGTPTPFVVSEHYRGVFYRAP